MNDNIDPELQKLYSENDKYSGQLPEVEPPPQQLRIQLPENKPVVVYFIMGITILVYLLQLGSNAIFGYDVVAIVGMKINEFIYIGEYWRLITPVFLHANLMHIGFNMYALNALGPQLERFYGSWQFLLLYLACGFGGVVASFALTDAASVGASTAIFGLLGAMGTFAYLNQKTFGDRAKRSLRSILQIAAINLLIGFTPGIDNWGHLGGLVAGVIIGWLGGPLFEIVRNQDFLQAKNSRTDNQFLMATLSAFLIFASVAVAMIFFNS
jgi:rhomboid protease GluP